MSTPAAPRTARPADAGVAGPGSGVPRLVVASSVTGTLVLALGAFWLSFTTLQDLAIMAGIPAGQAWVWPLIVDGVILEATISVVALRNQAPAARRYAWLLLASGAGVSVAANITHAIVAADARVPAVVAALVASVPPLVLLAMTHLTVELTRNAAPTRSDATPPAREDERAKPRPERTRPVSAGRERARGDRETREQAARLAADGISKRQIAAQLGKHPTTICRWLAVPDEDTEGDPS
ncbi:DUF2637 domain-containing protein [Microbacterium sp. NPDC077663]|uniref:DUF2637 domain-containing protein n=1 Tax=Microbacterium sp. NPDC077663 TaxID=3364189 RepID=UPI0037C6F922